MNRNDVIDVLTVVAAATRRTVGEADVDVWQAVIGDLPKDLAFRAVRHHLQHRPGVWLEPGHVYEGARAMRRDELEREPDSVREARQEALAAKAQEDIELLAERKGIQLTSRNFKRPDSHSPLKVACTWCRATPGQPCTVPRTNEQPAGGFHPSRVEAAMAGGVR